MFIIFFFINRIITTYKENRRLKIMYLYLNVPYNEKDEVKSLGARWNPRVKKWYIDAHPRKYVMFAKWILGDYGEAYIATKKLYIIEGKRRCWKCGQITRVVGLGIGDYYCLQKESVNDPCKIIPWKSPADRKEVHLAWTDDEYAVPPMLLQYLKKNYSVKTGYSQTINDYCFANHCDCCGAIQGNFFLFQEPDSPLSSSAEGQHLIKKMKQLVITEIPLEDDIQFYWGFGLCTSDYGYLEYGQYQKLVSNNPKINGFTYEDLYMI